MAVDYRAAAMAEIQECLDRNDRIRARLASPHSPDMTDRYQVNRRERLEIIDRLIALAATVPPAQPATEEGGGGDGCDT